MRLLDIIKFLINRAKNNFKVYMRRDKRFFYSVLNGTYRSRSFRWFQVKRYKTYRTISTFRLKALLTAKLAGLDTSASSIWTTGLLGAVLGVLIVNVDTISRGLIFNAMTPDMNWANAIIVTLFILDLAMPCIFFIISIVKGLSVSYTGRFYFLFFIAMIMLPFINIVPDISWIPLMLIILLLFNIDSFIITVVDISKQRMIIECNIIKTILVKRGVDVI